MKKSIRIKKIKLVLLPGMDGTGIMFQPFLKEIGKEFDPVVVSYPQDREISYEDLTEFVRTLLPRSKFIILGESFSGPIAIKIADSNPKGLMGLILCASFIKNPIKYTPHWIRFFIRAPLFYIWPITIKTRIFFRKKEDEELRDLFTEVKKVVKNQILAYRVREVLSVNVERELKRCKVPILYLGGKKDFVVSKHNSEIIKQIQVNVKIKFLHTAHLVLQEAPREALKEIKAFAQIFGGKRKS